jgi:2-C-methyl-D-erythritol 4-phosphate cytidylyltransferase
MAGEDKMMSDLLGEPVIVHTLRALELCPRIHEIIVVTRRDLIIPIGELAQATGFTKVTKIIAGGHTRIQSVRMGTLEADERAVLLAIHDGARPLVPQEVLDEVIQVAMTTHAAAPAVPVKDTIKRAVDGVVDSTPKREYLFAVQTPQVFSADLIKAALHRAITDGATVTDDCSVVERLGMKVTLTQGSDENIKITTAVDLAIATGILEWRNSI